MSLLICIFKKIAHALTYENNNKKNMHMIG